MDNAIKEEKKADSYKDKTEYWESMTNKIDLSMPESLEFFKFKLQEAIKYHKGLKDGTIKRDHSFSLTYAKKNVNEITKKHKIAVLLWE